MTANEAREISNQFNSKDYEDSLRIIEAKIKTACENGKGTCWVDGELNEDALKEVTSNGFTFTFIIHQGNSQYNFYW